jgi:uncharacterized phage-like protein YoqJ
MNNYILEQTVCFTGHRPDKLYGYDPFSEGNTNMLYKLRAIIEKFITDKGITTFITGMALGIDMWAGRIVLALREKYPHIKLICAIPCAKQWSKWNDDSRKEWDEITNNADEIIFVSEELYTPWCMQKRNEWMVNHVKYVLSVWNGTKGGTENCIIYAKKNDRTIINLHPKTLKVSILHNKK